MIRNFEENYHVIITCIIITCVVYSFEVSKVTIIIIIFCNYVNLVRKELYGSDIFIGF